MMRAAKLEREVRFIQRGAVLSRNHWDRRHVFFKSVQERRRRRAVDLMEAALDELKKLGPDPYLREGYIKNGAEFEMDSMPDRLASAIQHLKTAIPKYAVERDVDGERSLATRQLMDRLVDSSQRLYAFCNVKVLNHMLECDWFGRGTEYLADHRDLKSFLGRKQAVVGLRFEKMVSIPYEDFLSANLKEDWQALPPHPQHWVPGYTLEPPWLRW
jgi:hypothetical protein